MLALVAPCLKFDIDKNITLLISSIAAAQSVETIGNKETVNKIKMLKTLDNMLK